MCDRASEWRLPVKTPIRHPSACQCMTTQFSTSFSLQHYTKKKTLIEMWVYTRGFIQDMSSSEPVLVKWSKGGSRSMWVRDSGIVTVDLKIAHLSATWRRLIGDSEHKFMPSKALLLRDTMVKHWIPFNIMMGLIIASSSIFIKLSGIHEPYLCIHVCHQCNFVLDVV